MTCKACNNVNNTICPFCPDFLDDSSNKLVAELAYDAFPNVSHKASRLELSLNLCKSFDEKLIIITQYCSVAHKNGLTDCHHYTVTEAQYKQIFNAMLSLITLDFNNIIRYGMR